MRSLVLLPLAVLLTAFSAYAARSAAAAPLPAEEEKPTLAPLSPQILADMKRLQAAALESDYAYRQAMHLCDNIGPRLSGSPQYLEAAKYVAEQMRQEGLEVTLEKVMVRHWTRGEEEAELVEFPGMAPGTVQKLAVTALGGSVATAAEGVTAPVVVVHDFDELAHLGREGVSGKIALFVERFDRRQAAMGFSLQAYGRAVAYRSGGASAAARLGAVACLIRSVGGAEFRLPHTGAVDYADSVARIPAGALAAEDADMIERLAGQGPLRVHLLLTPQELPEVESCNVIADLKGATHPEQIVIVSAHLDSWDLGTGAIDDAAGVGVAMAAAHLMKKLGLVPERSLRVIAWANEENGLCGGITYAAHHQGDFSDHVAALEMDSGADHPVGIGYQTQPDAAEYLEPIRRVLASQGADLLQPWDDTGVDLIPLAAMGLPTFAPLQDSRTYFDYHHTAADTFDKIRPVELRENAAVVAVLAYGLAMMEDVPPHAAAKPLPGWLQARMEKIEAGAGSP